MTSLFCPSSIKPLSWAVPKTVVYVPVGPFHKQFERDLKRRSKIRGEKLIAGTIRCLLADEMALLGPAMGEPSAFLALAPLLASGAERIILCGSVGSLDGDRAPAAAIVMPDEVCGGPTAANLGFSGREHFPQSALQSALESALATSANAVTIAKGSIWTTDIPAQILSSEMDSLHQQAILAVEMELATVLQLSLLFHSKLAAAFAVTDIIDKSHSLFFHSKALANTLEVLAHELLSLAMAA